MIITYYLSHYFCSHFYIPITDMSDPLQLSNQWIYIVQGSECIMISLMTLVMYGKKKSSTAWTPYNSLQVWICDLHPFHRKISHVEYTGVFLYNHWRPVTNICVRGLGNRCLKVRLVPFPAVSHCLNHCQFVDVSICSLSIRSRGLSPDTYNCGLRMRRKCRELVPRHRLQMKPLVSDPGMHHGRCVTHVPWCMSGSLAPGGGENAVVGK